MKNEPNVSTIDLLATVAIVTTLFLATCSQESKAADTIDTYNQKHSLYAGIGYHSERYDCPEVCYGGDELAIVEYTYQHTKYTAAKALHISNYKIKERGFGTNAVFYGVYITW